MERNVKREGKGREDRHRTCTENRGNVGPSLSDVFPTENSWMLRLLDKVSLGYRAPDRTNPSQNPDFY
jgi:hypothetical protein